MAGTRTAAGTRSISRFGALVLSVLISSAGGAGCSFDSPKNRYILAEKLWTDGNYTASLTEFEKVIAKDPKSKLGLQALFRAAMTQTLYLNQHNEAVRKFRQYIDADSGSATAWEAQRQIGEILYSKTEQYDQVIPHYRALIKLKPELPESQEYLYRIAKSEFYLWRFDDAKRTYEEIVAKYPGTLWAEKAAYEIGVTYFTRGEQQVGEKGSGTEVYKKAIEIFKKFIKQYPESALIPEAHFGIASCHEELDQLDLAYSQYEALRGTYPSPNVIEIKLARIRERKTQRNR